MITNRCSLMHHVDILASLVCDFRPFAILRRSHDDASLELVFHSLLLVGSRVVVADVMQKLSLHRVRLVEKIVGHFIIANKTIY